jgi:hypothetical protein
MKTAPNTPRTESVYSVPTRVLAVVVWSMCAFLTVNLVMTGTPAAIWHFLPWMLLIAWGIYVLLWRPLLRVRADGLTVRNILRDHDIPFSQLTAMRVVQSVTFDTTAGRVTSWGAPGTGKLGPRMKTGAAGARTLDTLPLAQTSVQAAWDSWERSHSATALHDGGTSPGGNPAPLSGPHHKVATRWNLPSVVVGVLALMLAGASALT